MSQQRVRSSGETRVSRDGLAQLMSAQHRENEVGVGEMMDGVVGVEMRWSSNAT